MLGGQYTETESWEFDGDLLVMVEEGAAGGAVGAVVRQHGLVCSECGPRPGTEAGLVLTAPTLATVN